MGVYYQKAIDYLRADLCSRTLCRRRSSFPQFSLGYQYRRIYRQGGKAGVNGKLQRPYVAGLWGYPGIRISRFYAGVFFKKRPWRRNLLFSHLQPWWIDEMLHRGTKRASGKIWANPALRRDNQGNAPLWDFLEFKGRVCLPQSKYASEWTGYSLVFIAGINQTDNRFLTKRSREV